MAPKLPPIRVLPGAFRRSRSIAAIIVVGLFLTGILFSAISIISILGFVDFQRILSDLSSRTFPQATHEAQVSILLNQLLHQTGSLHGAKTHPERRIAFENIQQQFARISDYSANLPGDDRDERRPKVDNLNKILFDLNVLIMQRIDAHGKMLDAVSNLLALSQHVLDTARILKNQATRPENDTAADTIVSQALTLIARAERAVSRHGLLKIGEVEQAAELSLAEIGKVANTLPPHYREVLGSLLLRLRTEVLGEAGVLSAARHFQSLSIECDIRRTFAANLVEESEEASIADFFDLTSSVARQTSALSNRVGGFIKILTTLFIVSLVLATTFFFYFRHVLIARLLRLNRTVLAMVAGQKKLMAIDGSDEISEIARSVNYFSSEMHKAKEIAEKSAIAKAEFLAHMSHEIRTPLNAILGFSDLALKTSNPAEHLDYLGKINSGSYSLLNIINSILDYSKIEAGKFTIENVPFDLRELLEKLLPMIDLACEESGLNFYFHIEQDTPYALKGDPLRLSQVLTNLITNAFKFTKSGFITLHIKAAMETHGTTPSLAHLIFAVQDTGQGIPDEQARNLFQPFTQADTSITRRFGGTGLGLAICKHLVEIMGGNIHLEKNETRGSTFSFTLPLELLKDPERHNFFSAPASVSGKNVIVLSETPQTATELSCQLTSFGLRVFQALSFEEVGSALDGQEPCAPPDLVILDCTPYGQRFKETLRKFKLLLHDHNRPALVMIGMRRLATQFSAKNTADCDYFLEKPITPDRLLNALLAAMKQPPQALQHVSNPQKHGTPPNLDHFAGAKILLVEDNAINQQVMLGFLHSLGLSTVVAWNGAEALEILHRPEAEDFHLILMDLQMPVMDGYSTTLAIRQLPPPVGTLPVIAVTAHALHEEKEKCFQSGMTDYLTKPVDPNTLLTILAANLQSHGSSAANTPRRTRAELPEMLLGSRAGIDMQAGVDRVAGDVALYTDLLRTYLSSYHRSPEVMAEKFRQRHIEELRKTTHTLKGVCGNLGMTRLFSLCAHLEKSIKKKMFQECGFLLTEIERESDKICTFLRQYLDRIQESISHNLAPEEKEISPAQTRQTLLADLSSSLRNNSAKALKQMHQLRFHLEQEDGIVFARIEKHINNLDFIEASLLLEKWLGSMSGK